MSEESSRVIRGGGFRWQGVGVREYKSEGTHFRGITRQTLLGEGADEQSLNFVTRYFELEPGGYSSLERHRHPHAVVILRGEGELVLGNRVETVRPPDCVYVAPDTFHQFHATGGEPLGFLCTVDRERDRPRLPDEDELRELCRNPAVARRIRY
ncbi:MAG TPA: cupin domain-containing protein [Gammaproteobacteria bacterium]|nr:cupin domain-containing protein [Gammaproteobacteria bacterium]